MAIREEKYYYAQITWDFFDDVRLQYLESQPDGQLYSFFYLRLMLRSLKSNGRLRVSEKIACNDAMLARMTGVSESIVSPALEQLEELGLIRREADGTVCICDFMKYVLSESKWAEYKRRSRGEAAACDMAEDSGEEYTGAVQSASNECPTDVQNVSNECPIYTETEKETETKTKTETEKKAKTEKERENAPAGAPPPPEKRKYGNYGWIELTGTQYVQLLAELGEAELARCIAYIDESAQSTGNRNRWKDWALMLRRCSREGWGKPKAENEARTAPPAAAEAGPPEGGGGNDLERMKRYLEKLKSA